MNNLENTIKIVRAKAMKAAMATFDYKEYSRIIKDSVIEFIYNHGLSEEDLIFFRKEYCGLMRSAVVNGGIVAILNGNRVTVVSKDAAYSVGVEEPIPNQYGHEATITVKDALYKGILYVYNDDVDGPSHGLHGSLYYSID